MKKENPLISVILVNYNGVKWLADCLSSIYSQSYINFEIILVDNGSSDESVTFIKAKHKKVKLVLLKENVGFAGGNNAALPFAKGEYLCLLNTDTRIEKNYLREMIKPFIADPKLAIAQSKIVLMEKPDIIDTCGSFWTSSTFLYHYGNGKKASEKKYKKTMSVFSVKAASIMISHSVVKKIGLFDPSFWNYYEETDFCNRALISGYRCIYYPHAVCFHFGGGTTLSEFKYDYIQFHNFKNKLHSFLKNFERKTLIVVIPKYVVINVFISLLWLLQGKFKYFLAIYNAIFWNFMRIGATLEERREVQKHRILSDNDYLAGITRAPSLNYYKVLFSGNFKEYIDNE